jgi:hypothetical protein
MVPYVTIHPHPAAESYFLNINPNKPKLDGLDDPSVDPDELMRRLSSTPEYRTYRAMQACAYVTVWSQTAAHAHGIPSKSAGLIYVPQVGLVVVKPSELPAGGGSATDSR